MCQYGFIGLGIMGSGMARNLLKAGFSVKVWNRTTEKCAPFVELGAKQGKSAAEVAATCDITFGMVSDPAASLDLFFSSEGVLEGLGEGRSYIDMSTVDAVTSQKIAKAAAEKGVGFLEAPVSGSKKPAEDGTLIILAAGEKALFEKALPAFEVMGKKSVFLGDVGNGANMKLVVNMIMGSMMNAFCEGVTLAEKAELPVGELLDVLDAGAMSNPMFRGKGPNMQADNFAPAFPLKHMQKDMRLALLLGDILGHCMPVAASANERFKEAKGQGMADEDFSAVYKVTK